MKSIHQIDVSDKIPQFLIVTLISAAINDTVIKII